MYHRISSLGLSKNSYSEFNDAPLFSDRIFHFSTAMKVSIPTNTLPSDIHKHERTKTKIDEMKISKAIQMNRRQRIKFIQPQLQFQKNSIFPLRNNSHCRLLKAKNKNKGLKLQFNELITSKGAVKTIIQNRPPQYILNMQKSCKVRSINLAARPISAVLNHQHNKPSSVNRKEFDRYSYKTRSKQRLDNIIQPWCVGVDNIDFL